MAYKTPSHRSWFSYNLTRPYPFRWFTPVAFCGFVLFTILFSLLNVASTGYVLVAQSVTNPNETLSADPFPKWMPSYLRGNNRQTCQNLDIPMSTQLVTNNTALTYTLSGVWSMENDTRTVMPSMQYMNQVIEGCQLRKIEMDFKSFERPAVQIEISEWDVNVRAYLGCRIETPQGRLYFNMTTAYDYVPDTTLTGVFTSFLESGFLGRDPARKASLYWGESMLSIAWTYTTRTLQDIRQNQTYPGDSIVTKGRLVYEPNSSPTSGIRDLAFFNLDWQFITITPSGPPLFWLPPDGYNGNAADLIAQDTFPNIWLSADLLAKATYATILTDLGQTSAPHNLLTDADDLAYFTANFPEWSKRRANAVPGPALDSYTALKDTTGSLGVQPSVFERHYLCQRLQRKAPGTLLVSVLVADLVLLQAVWTLYKILVDWLCVSKRPEGLACEGCRRRSWEAIPLRDAES